MSANQMFEAKAKLFTKENNARPKYKSSIQSGDMQKLNRYFMEGQNTDGVWKSAEKLVEFIWFSLCFHFARRGREGWRKLTRQSFEIKTDDTGARYITEKLTEQTKNYLSPSAGPCSNLNPQSFLQNQFISLAQLYQNCTQHIQIGTMNIYHGKYEEPSPSTRKRRRIIESDDSD